MSFKRNVLNLYLVVRHTIAKAFQHGNSHPKKSDWVSLKRRSSTDPRLKSGTHDADSMPSFSFSGIRVFLSESKAAPLMAMYFLMLFLNTLLRDTKDTMLVTSGAGVEAIPILKSWVVIPASVSFFVVYSRLSTLLSKRALFHTLLLCFTSFYIFFALVLYPFKHIFTPTSYIQHLRLTTSTNFHPLLALLDEWPLGLFYVVSELWASAMCQLMFWQVANDVMTVTQAKSLYPIIGAMGNLGMVVAGRMLGYFADERDSVAALSYLRISASQQPQQQRNLEQSRILRVGGSNVMGSETASVGRGGINVDALDTALGQILPPTESETMQQLKKTAEINAHDEGWERTLFAISIIMTISCITIYLSYGSIYRRQRIQRILERLRQQDNNMRTGAAASETQTRNGYIVDMNDGLTTPSSSRNSIISSGKVNVGSRQRKLSDESAHSIGNNGYINGTTAAYNGILGINTEHNIDNNMKNDNINEVMCMSPLSKGSTGPVLRRGDVGSPMSISSSVIRGGGSLTGGLNRSNSVDELIRIDMTDDGLDIKSNSDGINVVHRDNSSDFDTSDEDGASTSGFGSATSGSTAGKKDKNQTKLSLRESLVALYQSVPLCCAAVLVASYGISITLVEVTWKGQVRHAFAEANDYSRFMGSFWVWTGLISMVFMVMGRAILQRFGYKIAVLFTPVIVFLAGVCFFFVTMYKQLNPVAGDEGPDAVIAAYAGGIAVLSAKAAKYALFDATKEIIFIPLDRDSQVLGKAAIDVVAYRLSKSGGSLILQVVIFSFGSLMAAKSLVVTATVFVIVLVAWLYAAATAGNLMQNEPQMIGTGKVDGGSGGGGVVDVEHVSSGNPQGFPRKRSTGKIAGDYV